MSSVKGKVVAITGASSGIGEAAARLLAQHGAHVVLGSRRTDRLEKLAAALNGEGGSAVYQSLNVVHLDQMESFIDLAVSRFGRVDVILNNAGVMPLSPLEALKVDEWNRMIDVNVRGVLHGIAAGLPVMQKQGFGQFINIASIGAYEDRLPLPFIVQPSMRFAQSRRGCDRRSGAKVSGLRKYRRA